MPITASTALPPLHPFTGMDLSSALRDRAATIPDETFLVWEPVPPQAACSWSYREFAVDVDRVAAWLSSRGVGPGDPVMLLLENSPAFLLCLFACAAVGAVAVNTNTRYAADELRYALELTRPVGVVTHERLRSVVEPSRELVGWLVAIDDDTARSGELFDDGTPVPSRAPDPVFPLCIQFTSGSTSRPKATLFTHANALWAGQVGCANQGLRHEDVALICAPLFHAGAFYWQLLPTFWIGGTVVLLPKFTATRFWDISCRNRCTTTFGLALMMQLLAEQEVPEHCYRLWILGAEMPWHEERYGIRTFSGYGMTETVSQAIVNHPVVPTHAGALGRVAPGYEIRVVGPEGRDVAAGEVGALRVRGVRGLSMFAEYFANAEATEAAFDEEGYFVTGDLVALLPDGVVTFHSREKDMLKVGGENVAAAEVERVLLGTPGVAAAAVVGRPDRMLGEVAVAFITVRSGVDAQTTRGDAAERCARELADFKVPRAIHVLDELPTLTIGKPAKAELASLAVSLEDPARAAG